ncbi:MAG: alpha/beta fold hydrolase [Prevotellaceae bacterium]|nr:alpha/beta fold hydrolase [Prevotellaceae bacterium]
MNRKSLSLNVVICMMAIAAATACSGERAAEATGNLPIVLKEQGSFSVGGRVVEHGGRFDMAHCYDANGQSAYGDHACVYYQIPAKVRKYPLVFLHGGGMTKRCWSTTPDGRDGFQNIFLRRGYGVYLVDQPRIGEAGGTTDADGNHKGRIVPAYNSRAKFTLFRLGEWPDFYTGVQFPKDSASVDQFLRQGAMTIGAENRDLTADAMAALLDKTGSAVLVTHSANGTVGWRTALRSDSLKAIVAYEPGGGRFGPFIFPKGEVPEAIPTYWGPIEPMEVEREEFMKLTNFPIVIYYGDNIATEPVTDAGRDQWRGELQMARLFAETINRYGGDCTVIHLPDIGIKGNTHFPFLDLNNVEIADLLEKFLQEKGLTGFAN